MMTDKMTSTSSNNKVPPTDKLSTMPPPPPPDSVNVRRRRRRGDIREQKPNTNGCSYSINLCDDEDCQIVVHGDKQEDVSVANSNKENDKVTNHENVILNQQTNRKMMEGLLSKPPRKNDDDENETMFDHGDIKTLFYESIQFLQTRQQLLKDKSNNNNSTTTFISKVLNNNTELTECIISASLCIPEQIPTLGTLLLDDNAISILKDCRKWMKECSSLLSSSIEKAQTAMSNEGRSSDKGRTTKSHTTTTTTKLQHDTYSTGNTQCSIIIDTCYHLLCVIVHCLRSIACTLRTSTVHKDTLILLFYHTISTADGLHQHIDTQSIGVASPDNHVVKTTKKDHEKDSECSSQRNNHLITHCFAAWEGFYFVCEGYDTSTIASHIKTEKESMKIRINYKQKKKKKKSQTKSSNESLSSSLHDTYLPSASIVLSETNQRSKPTGSYSLDQLSSMTINSLLSLTRIVCLLDRKDLVKAPTYFMFLLRKFQPGDVDQKELHISSILDTITNKLLIPWILISCQFGVSKETKTIENITSYCTKMFRLLWTCAKNHMQQQQQQHHDDNSYFEDGFKIQHIALQAYLLISEDHNEYDKTCVSSATTTRTTKKNIKNSTEGKPPYNHHLDEVYMYLFDKHFDKSCSYSWKATELYSNWILSKEKEKVKKNVTHFIKLLFNFHNNIGHQLDRLRIIHKKQSMEKQTERNDTTFLSYVEYCAYRALHHAHYKIQPIHSSTIADSSNNGIFSKLRFQYVRSKLTDKDTLTLEEVSLALFFYVLEIKESMNPKNEDKMSTANLVGMGEQIVSIFPAILSRCIVNDHILSCYKLLSVLKIHTLVSSLNNDKENYMIKVIVTTIILKCLNPMCNILLKGKILDESQHNQIWAITIYGYQLALISQRDAPSEATKESHKSFIFNGSTCVDFDERCLIDYFEILTCSNKQKNIKQMEYIEKAAQTMSKIGRNFLDHGAVDQALPYTLYSIKLFLSILPKYTSALPIVNTQLSNRFAVVSNIYKKLDQLDEAIAAICMSLFFYTMEAASGENDSSFQSSEVLGPLLHGLTQYTNGIVCDFEVNSVDGKNQRSYKRRRGLTRELFSLLSQRGQRREASSSFASKLVCPVQVIDVMLLGIQTGKPYHQNTAHLTLQEVLETLFHENFISKLCAINTISLRNERILMAMDILARTGEEIQNMDITNDPDSCTHCTVDIYEQIRNLIENEVQKLECARNDPSVILVLDLLNVVASSSLIAPNSTMLNFSMESYYHDATAAPLIANWGNIITYAEKFSDINNLPKSLNGDVDACFIAIRLLLEFYKLNLSFHGEVNNKPLTTQLDLNNVSRLILFLQTRMSSSSYKVMAVECTKRFLFLLFMLCTLDGESINACRVARWNALLHSEVTEDEKRWNESIELSLYSTSTYMPLNKSISTADVSHTQASEIEIAVSQLRLQICTCTDNDIVDEIRIKLLALESERKEIERKCRKDAVQRCLIQWVNTTIAMALAECAKRVSRLETALAIFRYCFKECKETMSKAKDAIRYSNLDKDSNVWYYRQITLIKCRGFIRQRECLQQIAILYCRLNDHRKALEYGKAVMSATHHRESTPDFKYSFSSILLSTRSQPCQTCDESKHGRFILRLLAAATPMDRLCEHFSTEDISLLKRRLIVWRERLSSNLQLEKALDIDTVFDMLYFCDQFSNSGMGIEHVLAEEAFKVHTDLNLEKPLHPFENPSMHDLHPRIHHTHIVNQTVMKYSNDSIDSKLFISLQEVMTSQFRSTTCCAKILYSLGKQSVDTLRRTQYLKAIWGGEKSFVIMRDDVETANLARSYFLKALMLLRSDCSILSRSIERYLGLLCGPESVDSMSCWRFLNASIGKQATREILRRITSYDDTSSDVDDDTLVQAWQEKSEVTCLDPLDSLFSERSDSFLVKFLDKVPLGWRFISAALCPTGEMLLTSMEASGDGETLDQKAACIFPTESNGNESVYEEIIVPLDKIISRSQGQLDGGTDGASKESPVDSRTWWNERNALNSELQDHFEAVQAILFRSDAAKSILCKTICTDDEEHDDTLVARNLSSALNSVLFDDLPKKSGEDIVDPTQMTVEELRKQLAAFGFKPIALRKKKKSELIELIHASKPATLHPSQSRQKIKPRGESVSECIFLILDQDLLRFPFESLPCFEGKTVCRVPSLAFALCNMDKWGASHLKFDAERVSYILDPESNLQATRERLEPWLQSISANLPYKWNSVIGSSPSTEFMQESLTEEEGLLLFFGHGNGKDFFSRRDIDSIGQHSSTDPPLSSVVLMGCSSGKLESVNQGRSITPRPAPMHYEPEGIALSYLLAGAPCVVANLWDVTDRDIDRFSISFLTNIMDHDDNRSLAQRVTDARSSCKMRYLVGAAPVCYGFPVFPKTSKNP